MIEKSRKMKDITLKEVSLVDKPANKRPFLLFKQEGKPSDGSLLKAKKKINIEIESDGTKKNTTVTVNGEKIANMKSFNFSVWSESPDDSSVSCSYSKLVESEGGFQRTESYYLAKGDSPMDERIKKIIEKTFGEKITKFEKAEFNEATITEIVKALETIEGYKDDFPTDLGAAIGLIAIHAGQGYKPTEKADSEKVDKASDEQTKKLETLIAEAQALLPTKKADTSKTDDNSSELKQTVEDLAKSVAAITGQLEKKETSDQLTTITEQLTDVSKRLKTIEGQPAGTKKSLEEDPAPAKREVKKDDQGRAIGSWPSLVGESEDE